MKEISIKGLLFGLFIGFLLGVYVDYSNSNKSNREIITDSEGNFLTVKIRSGKKTSSIFGLTIFGGFLGFGIGTILLQRNKKLNSKDDKTKKNWKEYNSGWGTFIPGGDKDHISVTNENAKVGKGFHITVEGQRIYFDDDGNSLGEGIDTSTILTKLNSMKSRGIISEKEYKESLSKLSKVKK